MDSFIPEPHLTFMCHESNGEVETIWDRLNLDLIQKINPNKFESNTLLGQLNRNKWQSVFEKITPIYEGMTWNKNLDSPQEFTYFPQQFEANIQSLLTAASNFFSKFSNQKIGVQLSGGLDSSIIICLLKELGIPFYAIGLTSDRYEFRTEKHIQQMLQSFAKTSILLNYENHLPFSNLTHLPAFQYPELSALNFSTEISMAHACEKLGITVLLSGDGGDILLGNAVPDSPNETKWMPQIFGSSWHSDIIYKPKGIDLIPFFADPKIMDVFFNLRRGQKRDPLKLWARNFLVDFLPPELSEYSYFADFWGLYISGLTNNLSEINNLIKSVYQFTGISDFHPSKIENIFKINLYANNQTNYQIIQSKVALAVWINSLISNRVI